MLLVCRSCGHVPADIQRRNKDGSVVRYGQLAHNHHEGRSTHAELLVSSAVRIGSTWTGCAGWSARRQRGRGRGADAAGPLLASPRQPAGQEVRPGSGDAARRFGDGTTRAGRA
jgi:hypothetical protein